MGKYFCYCSAAQSYPILCDSMDCNTPGFPFLHDISARVCSNSCLLRQWCHPTISSSISPFSFCTKSLQHQGLFQWVSSSHQVDKVLKLQFQHQSFKWIFQWIFRKWVFFLGFTGLFSLLSKGLSRVFSSTTVQKH